MAFEDQTKLWRVDVRGRYLGQDIVNTFQYVGGREGQPGFTPAQLFGAFTNGAGSPYRKLLRCMVEDYIAKTVIVYRESAFPERRYSQYFTVSDAGTIVDSGMPSQVTSVIIRRAIPQDAPGFRGRLYVGCVPVSDIAGGRIVDGSDYALALEDLRTAMLSIVQTPVPPAVVFNFAPVIDTSRRKVQPPRGIRWQTLTDTLVRVNLGNQRRRAPGHGRRG